MNALLGGIKSDSEIRKLKRECMVSQEELQAWLAAPNSREVQRPILSVPLRIYWDSPTSEWNEALSELFAQQFIRSNPEYIDHHEEVQKKFIQQITTLKGKLNPFVRQRPDETMEEVQARVQARDDSTHQLSRRSKRLTEASSHT